MNKKDQDNINKLYLERFINESIETTRIRLMDSDHQVIFERDEYIEFRPDYFIHDDQVYEYKGSDHNTNSITYQWAGASLKI